MNNFKQHAHQVIDIEQAAIHQLHQHIDESFEQACQLIMNCTGRVIVTGMGKSGHIGGKITATLASTGTPAFFVHPGEASHGDVGMITTNDVVIAISNSGETHEVLSIIPVIKRLGVKLIAMTGNTNSNLSALADAHISIKIEQEACPHGLAPTTSTTATLVMGDALAVALLNAKGFTADDFALSHPGGSLGKKLILRLHDIMHTKSRIPIVDKHVPITDALIEMSNKGLGMTAIINEEQQLIGLFTDGDLRRVLDEKVDIHHNAIETVMTQSPIVASSNILAAEALKIMQDNKINGLFIVDENNHPIGAMNVHDLLNAGVL